jgi:sigma-B regulation protein RsbU (phosphoserine phosphatase)
MSNPNGENNPDVALRCWKVWGGNGRTQSEVSIPGLSGVLYSFPCQAHHGGDLYYLSACGSGVQARLCLADVVGHGAGVAQFSAWLEEVFEAHIHRTSPAGVLRDVNKRVSQRGLEVVSTAVCLSYNSTNGALSYTYAGHPRVLLRRVGAPQWEELRTPDTEKQAPRNTPLGVSVKCGFDVHSLTLNPGDRLFLHTDGVAEARNDSATAFKDRLETLLLDRKDAPLNELADALLNAMRSHVGREEFDHDDVTYLLLEATPYQRGNRFYHFIRNHTPLFGPSSDNTISAPAEEHPA